MFKGGFKEKSKLSKVGLGFLSLVLISGGFNIATPSNDTKLADNPKPEIQQEVREQDDIKEKEKIEEERKAEEAKEKADKEAKELEEKKKIEEEEKQKEEIEASKSKTEELSSKSTNAVQQTNTSSDSGSGSNSQSSTNQPVQQKIEEVQPEPLTNSQNVYITKTGSKYHRGKCGKGNFFEASLQEAQSRGLETCSKCY